jgi:starch synthase
MAGLPNPVLQYHPDAYRAARQDLKGRHSAGESFLAAFLEQAAGPDVYALTDTAEGFKEFAGIVSGCGRKLAAKRVARDDLATLRAQALLNLPHPELAREARLRNFIGSQTYALCGLTHTISSREVLDGVAALATAPVKTWDALICTSKAVHDALSAVLDQTEQELRDRIGASRFTRPMMPILPLGTHARRFARSPIDRKRWREQLGIEEATVTVLFFGRLSFHAKASPLQLAQAAELAAGRGTRRYAIIWCGWFNDDHQRRVFMQTAKGMAPSVAFHHVDGRDENARFSIWSAADIFCSLSDNIQESFGLTVIEAMAAELPVVASNWNGYREAIEHGVNGVLIDSYLPRVSLADAAYRYMSGTDTYDTYIGGLSQFCMVDVEQVAQWFERLAVDEPMRRKFAAAARRTVEEKFDWKELLPRYGELWREQIERIERARREDPQASVPSKPGLDPAATFSGFPSHRLTGETQLARGPNFERWNDLVKEPGIVVNGALLVGKSEFRDIEAAFADGHARQVKDLLELLQKEKRDKAFRALHWLVKIGLLRLSARDG